MFSIIDLQMKFLGKEACIKKEINSEGKGRESEKKERGGEEEQEREKDCRISIRNKEKKIPAPFLPSKIH